jgi:hypothetical protein
MPSVRLPQLQVVARGERTKTGLGRPLTKPHQLRHWKLFVPQHEANNLRGCEAATRLLGVRASLVQTTHRLRKRGLESATGAVINAEVDFNSSLCTTSDRI